MLKVCGSVTQHSDKRGSKVNDKGTKRIKIQILVSFNNNSIYIKKLSSNQRKQPSKFSCFGKAEVTEVGERNWKPNWVSYCDVVGYNSQWCGAHRPAESNPKEHTLWDSIIRLCFGNKYGAKVDDESIKHDMRQARLLRLETFSEEEGNKTSWNEIKQCLREMRQRCFDKSLSQKAILTFGVGSLSMWCRGEGKWGKMENWYAQCWEIHNKRHIKQQACSRELNK